MASSDLAFYEKLRSHIQPPDESNINFKDKHHFYTNNSGSDDDDLNVAKVNQEENQFVSPDIVEEDPLYVEQAIEDVLSEPLLDLSINEGELQHTM